MTAGDPTDNPRRLLDELLAIRAALGEDAAQGIDPDRIPILNDVVARPPPEEGQAGLENIDEEAIHDTEVLAADAPAAASSGEPEGGYAELLDIEVAIPNFTLDNVLIDEDEPAPLTLTAELPPLPEADPAPIQPRPPTETRPGSDPSGGDQSIADYLAASLTESGQEPQGDLEADRCDAGRPPEALIDELVAEWLPTLENALRERLMRMTTEQIDLLRRR